MLDILLNMHTQDSLLIGFGASDIMQAQSLTLVKMSAQRILTRIITEVEVCYGLSLCGPSLLQAKTSSY